MAKTRLTTELTPLLSEQNSVERKPSHPFWENRNLMTTVNEFLKFNERNNLRSTNNSFKDIFDGVYREKKPLFFSQPMNVNLPILASHQKNQKKITLQKRREDLIQKIIDDVRYDFHDVADDIFGFGTVYDIENYLKNNSFPYASFFLRVFCLALAVLMEAMVIWLTLSAIPAVVGLGTLASISLMFISLSGSALVYPLLIIIGAENQMSHTWSKWSILRTIQPLYEDLKKIDQELIGLKDKTPNKENQETKREEPAVRCSA